MAKRILIIFFLCVAQSVSGQSFDWIRQAGSAGGNDAITAVVTSDNYPDTVFTAGTFEDTLPGSTATIATGGKDIFIRATRNTGGVAFTGVQYASLGSNDAVHAAEYGNDSYYITGKLDGNTTVGSINGSYGAGSFYVSKINTLGNVDWMVPDTNQSISEGQALAAGTGGDLYVAGTFRDSIFKGSNQLIAAGVNVFIAKYSSTGSLLWTTVFETSGNIEVTGLQYESNSNNLFISGNFDQVLRFNASSTVSPAQPSNFDVFVARLSGSTGAFVDGYRPFYSSGEVESRDMELVGSQNLVVVGAFTTSITGGNTSLTSAGGTDGFIGVFEYGTTPTVNVLKAYGGNANESIEEVDYFKRLFAMGEYSSGTFMFGSDTLTTNSAKDIFLMSWSGSGLNEYSAHGGVGILPTDEISVLDMALANVDSTALYFAGDFRANAEFGNQGVFQTRSNINFDGYLARIDAHSVFCPISDSIFYSSDFKSNNLDDTLRLCNGTAGAMKPKASGTNFTYDWRDSLNAGVSLSTNATLNVNSSGTYFAIITNTNRGCTDTSYAVKVKVESPVSVTINNDTTVCEGTNAFPISVVPAGGSFVRSSGILGGSFNSGLVNGGSGSGVDTIAYSIVNALGCLGVDTAIYTVQAKPIINFSSLPVFCNNQKPDTLKFASSPTQKLGYYYMSPSYGIKDSVLFRCDTLLASSSGHSVFYYAEDTLGCSQIRSASIVVNGKPNVTWTNPPTRVCENADAIVLSGGSPLINGKYGGPGVTPTGLFKPDSAKRGSHQISYTHTDALGCTDSILKTIIVDSIPIVSFTFNKNICEGDLIAALSGGEPSTKGTVKYTSVWVKPDLNGGFDFYPRLSGVGSHTVTYSFVDNNGCSDSIAGPVVVLNKPVVTVANFAPICENDSSKLVDIGTPKGGEYFSRGVLLRNDTLNPRLFPKLIGAAKDTITYRYTDANGCKAEARTELTIHRLPSMLFNPVLNQNRLCNNDSLDFVAMGDTLFTPAPSSGGRFIDENGQTFTLFKPDTYLPLTADTSKLSSVSYIFDYQLTGCSDTITRNIRIAPSPRPAITAPASVCLGLKATIQATGGTKYIWDNQSESNSIQVEQTVPTRYHVTVENADGCKDSISQLLEMTAGNVIKAKNTTVTLKKGGDVTYEVLDLYSTDTIALIGELLVTQAPKNALDFTNNLGIQEGVVSQFYYQPETEFRRRDSVFYRVCDVNCANLCDTGWVQFNVLGDPYDFIPNGFSPNGDGMNDTWVVPGIEAFPNNELYIYNRWGDLIFKSAPYNNEWEGQSNAGIGGSSKVGDGTYFYVLITNEGAPLKGTIEMKSK